MKVLNVSQIWARVILLSGYEPMDATPVFEDVDGQFASTSKENGQQ